MEISNQFKLDILKELLASESYNYRLVYLRKDENDKFYIDDIFGDPNFQKIYEIRLYSFQYAMTRYNEAIYKGTTYDKVLCVTRSGDDTWEKGGIEWTLQDVFNYFTHKITAAQFMDIFFKIYEKYNGSVLKCSK